MAEEKKSSTIYADDDDDGGGGGGNIEDGDIRIRISRQVLTQSEFDKSYHDDTEEKWFNEQTCPKKFAYESKRICRKRLPRSASSFFLGLFPFINIMRQYNWRQDLLKELAAGATVAFLHVPQAMAYGQLASLRPVYGLYNAFFPVVIYFFFGTSRQMSFGTSPIVSLMVAKVLDSEIASGSYDLPPVKPNASSTILFKNSNVTLNDYEDMEAMLRVDIATSLCIITGIFQLILGATGTGFIASYLNEPFISGYITASACHVVMSQIFQAVGIKGIRHTGAFKIIFVSHSLVFCL